MNRPRWPDPPPAPDDFPRRIVTSPTDADLALHHRPAVRGAGRGVVCILHDVAEHAARYAPTARTLADAGFHVYAHDHRGHGATRAFDAPPGVFAARDGFDRVLEDAVFVNDEARAAHRGLPLIVFGQGFGGLLALCQAIERPDAADGLAIWNADVDASGLAEIRRAIAMAGIFGTRRGGRRAHARLLDAYNRPFRPSRTDYDWLSRDPDAVDRYVADPLCGWPPSVAMWRDVLAGVERVQAEDAFGAIPRAAPLHLLAGSDDPATASGQSIVGLDLKLRDLGFTDVSRVILGGARHDTLNDLGRDDALRMLVRWIERVAAELPPFQ
jgi:alpha-beta hydrolase superfamily lysophospholipase